MTGSEGQLRRDRAATAGPLSRLPGGVGPALAVVGLVIVAVLSLALLSGRLPKLPGSGNTGPIRTPTPSGVVIVDPGVDLAGSLLYVKSGNIWIRSGKDNRQLTSGGVDAMPTWSPDGQWIYFVRSKEEHGTWPMSGVLKTYDLQVPILERMHRDGSGTESLLTGRVERGSNVWSYFIREPSISPDGQTAAIVTDGPDPTRSDIVLKFVDIATRTLTNPRLPSVSGLGHQDPAWSPDGRTVLYVRNVRSGTKGAPVIVAYDRETKKTSELTGPGYIQPAWSPDGRYVAATKTESLGTNVVVLDARSGAEVLRLTSDDKSYGPVWSPAGNAIAFYRSDEGVVDLELAQLGGSAPQWKVEKTAALTLSAGLDGETHAAWFIPPDQLPKATPPPSTTAPSAGQ